MKFGIALRRRRAGVLLHPSSLPGLDGIGDIGPAARRFVERLGDGGVSAWQMLPLGPTGYGDSPYQSLSSFAGNPMLISLEDLVADGWLDPSDLVGAPGDPCAVEFGALIPWKRARLQKAVERWRQAASPAERRAMVAFARRSAEWLDDFALFAALKDAHRGAPWTAWPAPLARREPAALEAARRRWADDIERVRIEQFFFSRQWARLRSTAHANGVTLIGDVPIFVAHDSADVWARRDLFELDGDGMPTLVAGVPPDYFSATGQLWGNPLYRWEVHRADRFAWWRSRLRHALAAVDVVRLDHFRGFEAYWAVPAGEATALRGQWMPGPGAAFFDAAREDLGRVPILAEDLGYITEAVHRLRRQFRLPGMLVLQFTIDRLLEPNGRPPEWVPADTVLYTGTHDNDTAAGWFHAPPGRDSTESPDRHRAIRAALLAYVGGDGRDIHRRLIDLAWRSRACLAVAPVQDVFGLGSEARMNVPGRPEGNWRWRATDDQLDGPDWVWLRDVTSRRGRAPPAAAR